MCTNVQFTVQSTVQDSTVHVGSLLIVKVIIVFTTFTYVNNMLTSNPVNMRNKYPI